MAEAELQAKLEGTRRRRRRREEKDKGEYDDELEWKLIEDFPEHLVRPDIVQDSSTWTRGSSMGRMMER
eukprot:726294-Hanusia_phi.AAC.1